PSLPLTVLHSSRLAISPPHWPPPRPTLFPYTTLFRSSGAYLESALAGRFQPLAAIAFPQTHDPQARAKALLRMHPRRHHPLDQADRKSTRLNSSHQIISYAVFCLKKKKQKKHT